MDVESHGQLALQLTISGGMVVFTVLIHLLGLALLLLMLRFQKRHLRFRKEGVTQVLQVLAAAFGLFALHILEIFVYAFLYQAVEAFPDFETALYFSTSCYTTLGFGDVLLEREWRMLGAVEAANGLVLIGWSTAFFVSIIGRLRTLEQGWFRLSDEDD